MKVNLTKVQQLIDDGMTLAEFAEVLTERGKEGPVHYTTISLALRRGTVSKRVARAISKALNIPMQKLRSVA